MADTPHGGWRDIESAPRDGTPLLLYSPGLDADQWYRIDGMPNIVVGLWEVEADRPGGGRWLSDVGDIGEGLIVTLKPTHWQPLPAPPETENG